MSTRARAQHSRGEINARIRECVAEIEHSEYFNQPIVIVGTGEMNYEVTCGPIIPGVFVKFVEITNGGDETPYSFVWPLDVDLAKGLFLSEAR